MSGIDYTGMSDEEIVSRIRNHDREAADYLMDRYKNLVRKKAKALYLIGGDREDLIQEGMIGLYKAMRDYQAGKEASFLTFADLCISRQLYSAIKRSNTKRNLPLNHYISFETPQQSKRGEVFEQTLLLDVLAQNPVLNPEEQVIGQDSANWIEAALEERLSVFEKEILSLYLQDYSYGQIAVMLKKEPKAVDNALQRIKKKLKFLLEDM